MPTKHESFKALTKNVNNGVNKRTALTTLNFTLQFDFHPQAVFNQDNPSEKLETKESNKHICASISAKLTGGNVEIRNKRGDTSRNMSWKRPIRNPDYFFSFIQTY